MLHADGHDDLPGRELLAIGEGELEAASLPDHSRNENLLDFQVEFGLKPLAVADKVLQRYRESVAFVGAARGLAEGLKRMCGLGIGKVRGEALGLQEHPLR